MNIKLLQIYYAFNLVLKTKINNIFKYSLARRYNQTENPYQKYLYNHIT